MATETIQTVHGDVEVQLHECENCGENVQDKQAVPVGLNVSTRFGIFEGLKTQNGYRRHLCPYCAENIFGIKVSNGSAVSSKDAILEKFARADVDEMFFGLFMALVVGGSICLIVLIGVAAMLGF